MCLMNRGGSGLVNIDRGEESEIQCMTRLQPPRVTSRDVDMAWSKPGSGKENVEEIKDLQAL